MSDLERTRAPVCISMRSALSHSGRALAVDYVFRANRGSMEKLRAICEREGYPAPVICTPHELMV